MFLLLQVLIAVVALLGATYAVLAADETVEEVATDVEEEPEQDPSYIRRILFPVKSYLRPYRPRYTEEEEDDDGLPALRPTVMEPDLSDAEEDYGRRRYHRYRHSGGKIYKQNVAICNGRRCNIVQLGYRRRFPCRGYKDRFCTPSMIHVRNLAKCYGQYCRILQQDM